MKMKPYLVGQTTHITSRVCLLRILLTKPRSLNSKLPDWAILLFHYDMHFNPQTSIKGQTIIDFSTEHPIPKSSTLYEGTPDETLEDSTILKKDALDNITELNVTSNEVWKLFFDGASRMRPK